MRLRLFTLFTVILFTLTSVLAQTITTVTVTPVPACAGGDVSVTFVTTGTFAAGNQFTIQLSNAAGSFTSPVNLGTATSPASVTIPAGSATGAGYKIKVLASNPAVSKESAAFTVTNLAAPVISGTVADVCQGTPVTAGTLTAAVTASGGASLLWYTAATGGTGTASPVVAGLTALAGTKTLYVSQKSGSCESARAPLSFQVNAVPTAPAVSNLDNTCVNSSVTAAMLLAKVTGGSGQLKWYPGPSGGTGSTTTPVPSTTTPGTKDFYVSQTVDGCESPRAKISLVVNAIPAAPGTTNLDDVCLNQPVTAAMLLAKVTSASGQLRWYTTATNGTGSTTTPVPNTATAGTKDFYVSRTVGGCESPRAKISLVVKPNPAAPTVISPLNTCFGTSPAPALTATGTGLLWYTSSSGTGSATKPVVSTATAGSVDYFVTQTVNGCESPKATIKVNVYQTAKPVVTDKAYCRGETPAALTATGTALKWYTTATGGTGSTSAPTVTTTTVGTQTYYVTQTLNGCESDRARIDVVIKQVPAAPTVTALPDVCQSTSVTATQLLNSVTTATGTLKWYTTATAGTGQATAYTPVTTTAGTRTYYVSQTVNSCESPRAAISMVVKALPAAPTVTTPKEFCQASVATALEATAAAAHTLSWYTVQTGGTALAAAPVPSTTTAGSTPYYVSQVQKHSAALSCEGPRARLNVVINPLPAQPTVTNQVECQTRTDQTLPYKAAAGSGNSLLWAAAATGGTESTTVPSVNLKTAGEFSYFVSQKTAKGCIGNRREVKIRVKKLPGLPTVTPNLEYCQFDDAPALSATPESAATINWYGQLATGGNPVASAPTPSTMTGGNFSFFVSQTLEACEGDRAEIKVLIKTTPEPAVNSPISYCHNEEAVPLTATGQQLKWYRPTGEMQTNPFTPFTQSVGDQYFYVTQTGDNGCESPKEEIKITIKPKPSATISGTTSIEYGRTATIKIDFTSEGPWSYKLSNGLEGSTEHNPLLIQVQPSTTTTYLVTNVSNSCGEGTPIGNAVVTVLIPTITTGNPNLVTICAGKILTVPFQRSGTFPSDNKFVIQVSKSEDDDSFVTIPTTISGTNANGTVPDTLSGGNYYIRVVGESALPPIVGSVSGVSVTVQPLPTATLTENKTILIGETAQIPVVLTGNAPWTFSYSNGKATFPPVTTDVSPFLLSLTPDTTTVYTLTSVINACGSGAINGQSRIQVDPILGIEPEKNNWVKVLPTLIEETCTIAITEAIQPGNAVMQLMDITGRTLKTQNIQSKITEVRLSSLPSGIYLMHIRNGNDRALVKILKQ